MRNPLNKRVLRDLKKDWGKYLALFVLMSFMIGIASGTFVGNDSMMHAIEESYEKYNIEYGHFELKNKPAEDLVDCFRNEVTIYEQFYKDAEELIIGKDDYAGIARIFKVREEVNLPCLMEGRLPEKSNEIAIDRAHGNNNKIGPGDKLKVGGKEYEIVGLVASPDYSSLFKNNADIMFDAVNFDIAFMTEEGWDRIKESVKYQYAFDYSNNPADEIQEKEWADDLLEKLAVLAATGGYTSNKDEAEELSDNVEALEPYDENANELVDFVPRYANQSIKFAEKDLGKDQAMMNVLVYIFIAVLAFVFAITTGNKIKDEAAIIGTLRATGYTKGELIRFYMLIPVVITLLACLTGNILGYTYFKNVAVGLYYNSYSLLKYETLWNPKAFIITTLIPLGLMVIVNFIAIHRLMKLSPMKFLRRDLSVSKKKKAAKLPAWSFFSRFRLRILHQNLFDYVTLFIGIVFIMLLLGFSVGLPQTIENYKDIATENVLADYQTVLKDYKDADGNVITTQTEEAEKFSTTSLIAAEGVRPGETITVYGYEEGSRYFTFAGIADVLMEEELAEDEVFISSSFHAKFGYDIGDKVVLKEQYAKKEYTFYVKGIYEFPTGLVMFMPNEHFNKTFDKDQGSFTGYLSRQRITDIDEDLVYTVITIDDVMTLANQLDHSMGGFAGYISGFCLIMGVLVMYLLTKLIIEKNATSISMVKVLGYENSEINSLYIRLTTLVTVLLTLVAAVAGLALLGFFFRLVMNGMEGWLDLYISPMGVVKMIAIVLAAYIIVAYLDMRHIKKIPLTEALKNVE